MFLFVANSLATSIEVIFHDFRTFGVRYLGLNVLFTLLFIISFLCFFHPERDSWDPLMSFAGLYLYLAVLARIVAWRRASRGDSTHSFYSGAPWIMSRDNGAFELRIKLWFEPIMSSCISLFLLDLNRPLGIYLIIATACLWIVRVHSAITIRARVLDMNDAVADQEIVTDQFRHMRRDSF